MATSQSRNYELINQLAEEFAERYRRGDHPTLSEFTARHPHLAEEIRELFPALLAIERVERICREQEPPPQVPSGFQQLGDYRIVREVGHGGMGIVYEAEQVSLGRRVALKVLPNSRLYDGRQQRRFEREARAAARLHHTNIVPVFGIGEQDGIHYYVMQIIQGLGLDRVLDELKQVAAGSGRLDDASSPIGERDRLGQANVCAAAMARSLLSGAFDRTGMNSGSPALGDPGPNDPGPSDAVGRQFQNTEAWPPERNCPANSVAKSVSTSDRTPAVSTPKADPAPLTATAHLTDTLALSASVALPWQIGGANPEIVKKQTYWQSVAQIGMQVAGALAYAHGQGVVHRDIKPSNLLLDVRGTVWVADFGLAKATDSQGLTDTGDILGTLRYMPPEAFTGAADSLGDIYSLGLTLYELLALRPAFDDKNRHQLIKLVTTGEPAPLDKLKPEIPRDLVTIVHKAIERDPRQRYQTAREFADDLLRFLADMPVHARRNSRFERGWRWCRRNPAVAGLLGTVAALLTTIAAVAVVSALRLDAGRQATQHQLELTIKAENEATRRLYSSLVDQARANRLSRRAGQRFKSLEALAEASQLAKTTSLPEADRLELRNQVIACLTLFDVRDSQTWDGWPAGSDAVDFEPGFERYARTDREGNVHIHSAADGVEIWKLAGVGPGESWVQYSPDGRYLRNWTYGIANRMRIWDLGNKTPVVLMDRPVGQCGYRLDSREMACQEAGGALRLFRLPSAEIAGQFETGIVPSYLDYQPVGQLLAISHKKGIQIRQTDTGDLVKEFVQATGVECVRWSPDGKSLAGVRADQSIQIWDVGTGQPILLLSGHKQRGVGLSFNHAGDLLASHDWGGSLRLWDPHTGEQLFQAPIGISNLRFSPDDDRLAALVPRNGRLGILELAKARNFYRTLVRDPVLGNGAYYNPSVSPDGRLLAVGMADGVGFWDLAGGKPLKFVPGGMTYSVLFDPSGSLLVSGPTGVSRWPIDFDPQARESVRIKTAESLPFSNSWSANLSISRDGRVIAKPMYSAGALVWHRDSPKPPIALAPHRDTRTVSVSPDGRLVATGSHTFPNVKIWDAATGKLLHELILETMNGVYFSPDGRWLVTTSGGMRVWSTETWKEVHYLGDGAAVQFSPDGKLLAIGNLAGVVRLINPETSAEYARLEDPHQDWAGRICFSPDGSQLLTTTNNSGSIHVWNLRAIRAQLSEMGLDWDLPAYPSPTDQHATVGSFAN